MKFDNILKLIKAYFYENWQKDAFYTFGIIALLTLFFVLFRSSLQVIFLVAAVFMMIMPARVFEKLHNPSSRIQYLTIPASSGEKVVTGMLLANIYYVVGICVSILIGALVGIGILKFINPEMSAFQAESMKELFKIDGTTVMLLFVGIAIFFFGSIYFRKSPVWKVVLTGFIISTVFGLLMTGTVWLNELAVVPEAIRHGGYYRVEEFMTQPKEWVDYLIMAVAIVYCYALSFLRMRETEA